MIKQNLRLKLSQKMAPQQIQLMRLIQLSTIEFEQNLQKEIEENPAIEIASETFNEDSYDEFENNEDSTDFDVEDYLFDEEPTYKTSTANYSPDDETYDSQNVIVEKQTLYDYLMEQIQMTHLEGEDLRIAQYLIGSLDPADGYLRRDIKSIVDDMAFMQGLYTTEDKVKNILENYIQKLDPVGVGARNLQECLLLQIETKVSRDPIVGLTAEILRNNYDAIINRHYEKIMSRYDIDEIMLKNVLNEIAKLDPKVGGNFDTETLDINKDIIPDFTIIVEEHPDKNYEVKALLNSKNAPELKVSPEYQAILQNYSNDKNGEHKQTALFIKQKLDSAKWFIDAVNQRQDTLMKTINAIIEIQKEYFVNNDERVLKPMILKDIADKTGFDISTISRVVKSKYADTPNGIIHLRDLFSDGFLNEEGEEISTKEIKRSLMEIIDNEDKTKPLTDDNLVNILKEKGYNIARRTIAKYREQLNIPVARLRREL